MPSRLIPSAFLHNVIPFHLRRVRFCQRRQFKTSMMGGIAKIYKLSLLHDRQLRSDQRLQYQVVPSLLRAQIQQQQQEPEHILAHI